METCRKAPWPERGEGGGGPFARAESYGKFEFEGHHQNISSQRRTEKRQEKGGDTEKKVNLQVTAEGVIAVQEFNLDIKDKEFIVLVGPSGCGKSTTLRMVAGLEEISGGELYIDGKLMNDVEPKNRDIAMVFQSYALYPHMTVYENMAFPLKLRKMPKDEIDRRVKEAAETLDITQYLEAVFISV